MILAKTGFALKLNPNGYSDYVCEAGEAVNCKFLVFH